jgi:uncharacterized protein YggE
MLLINTKMKLYFLVILLCFSCFTAVGCDDSNHGSETYYNSGDQGITVTGVGKIKVIPDIASFTVSVEVEDKNVNQASNQVGKVSRSMIDELVLNGVVRADIVTSSINIYPRYDWSRDTQTLVGYVASVSVKVTVREIKRVGEIIDSVIEIGGNDVRLNGLAFDIGDQTEYVNLARELAAKDAKNRAKHLAILHDVKLGKPLRISEFEAPNYNQYARSEAAYTASDSLPVEVGSLMVSVSLAVQWAIAD